jgi:predicted transcriptional regulator
MSGTLTIRLDDKLQRQLDDLARASGRTRSDIVREALRRQLAMESFEALRRRLAPLAEARGWVTDEDVFRNIS